jgi:single-strand DNA-binding protein
MSDLNQCTITGRLGADPETRRKQDGSPIVNLRVACAETWRDKNNGDRKEKTEWFSVVIFSEGLCKVAEQYLKKGSKVLLQGKIATRKWQDKDGNDRFSTELVLQGFDAKLIMLDGPGDKPKDDRPVSRSEPDRPSLQDDMDGDSIPF